MNREFVTVRFDPKDATLNMTPEELKEKAWTGHPLALILPKWEPQGDNDHYMKLMIECVATQLRQLADTVKPNPAKDFDRAMKGETEYGIHIEMMFLLKKMANTLEWMTHCTSWREGKCHGFDQHEINSQIKRMSL